MRIHLVDGAVDGCPLDEQLLEGGGAVGREAVEALVALFFLAPFAGQQALRLQAAEQRVEGALLNVDPDIGERLAQGVAVVLVAKLGRAPPGSGSRGGAPAAGFQIRIEWLRSYCALHTV